MIFYNILKNVEAGSVLCLDRAVLEESLASIEPLIRLTGTEIVWNRFPIAF